MDDSGARRLMAAILKQAYDDYTKGDSCPAWCQFKDECKTMKIDKNECDAKRFIHSAWCATLLDGLGLDHQEYINACLKKHRLSKNTYRYIENEIKSYKNKKRELERLKGDIIHSTPIPQEIRGSNTGDTTADKAIKISLDKKIADMERTIKAIEKIFNSLDKDKKEVMQQIWERKYTNLGLAEKIGVDERTIRRWKNRIIYAVAIELNYL